MALRQILITLVCVHSGCVVLLELCLLLFARLKTAVFRDIFDICFHF